MTDHPTRKLGRRSPKRAPALKLSSFFDATAVPKHDVSDDNLGNLPFVLGRNNAIGDCGPVYVANSLIAATGGTVVPTDDQIVKFYSYVSGFDPSQTDAQGNNPTDVGVDLQDMLEKLLQVGMAGRKPVAFAKVDSLDEDFLEAAINAFLGTGYGVDLEVAQQDQTDEHPPVWDYERSADWGGHAIYGGQYDATGRITVISWKLKVVMTPLFRERQLEEAWIIIWPELVNAPGVDRAALAEAYKEVTGKTLPVPAPPPTPAPTPEPVPPAPDPAPPKRRTFFQVGPFSDLQTHHLVVQAKRKGYPSVEKYLTALIKHGG